MVSSENIHIHVLNFTVKFLSEMDEKFCESASKFEADVSCLHYINEVGSHITVRKKIVYSFNCTHESNVAVQWSYNTTRYAKPGDHVCKFNGYQHTDEWGL